MTLLGPLGATPYYSTNPGPKLDSYPFGNSISGSKKTGIVTPLAGTTATAGKGEPGAETADAAEDEEAAVAAAEAEPEADEAEAAAPETNSVEYVSHNLLHSP